jgi:hypothetical protein
MTTQSNYLERIEKILGRSAKDDLGESLRTHNRLQGLRSQMLKSYTNIKHSASLWMNYTLGLMGISIIILGTAYLLCALIFYFLSS